MQEERRLNEVEMDDLTDELTYFDFKVRRLIFNTLCENLKQNYVFFNNKRLSQGSRPVVDNDQAVFDLKFTHFMSAYTIGHKSKKKNKY